MNQEDMDKLQEAISIIFNIEQKWRKEKYDYAADTLYKARIEINNTRSRGQRTKEDRDLKYIEILHHNICYYFDDINITIEYKTSLWSAIKQDIMDDKITGELRIINHAERENDWLGRWYII